MKKKMMIIVALFVLTLSLTACSSNAVKIGADANGQTIELAAGQKLVLSLESNPTTGFDWEVSEIDEAVIKQSGESEYKSESDLLGAGGVRTFTFKAVAAGTSTLKLVYHRSWEKDIPPEQEFTVTINVK
ncbi:MAG: protease inhibitor I42 family protein [Anaerolineaceae bacterium]|nr:protease inhibitor I42 family protein [Anaerolineaceae bacterium]